MLNARRLLAILAMAAFTCSCGPVTTQPVQVMALTRPAGGKYKPTQVALSSLSDVVKLDGSVAYLVGGAEIDTNPGNRLLQLNGGAVTDEELANIFIEVDGAPPHASYVEKDGVLWPADFDTWNLVTTYYNVEQSFLFFQDAGVPGETLARLRVFYFPSFKEGGGTTELKDGALYHPNVKSMMVLPFDKLQEAPVSINSTVMAHEYAHVVWHRMVYGDQARPQALTAWANSGLTTSPAANVLKAIDEGFADFHAVAQSCRTSFGCDTRGNESSYGAAAADARDMALNDKCMDATLNNAFFSSGIGEFLAGGYHYRVGTVFASSLYHAGRQPDDWAVLSKSLISIYPRLRALIDANLTTPANFTLAAVADLVLEGITSIELQTRVCGEFLGRLKIDRAALPNCPAQSIPSGDCP